MPHYMNRNGSTDIETPVPGVTVDYDAEALADALRDRDHTVNIRTQTSGLSIIQVVQQPGEDGGTILIGGADQRRDGTVGGR